MSDALKGWKIAGLAMLPARFVQGWIFWGGGSRRFIYDPSKLDPHAHEWMANKLQSAMPGAILGVGSIINFILQHFYLLYVSIIVFSLIELLSGLALILGFCSRFAAFASMLVSVVLMLAFGWQGATCMDEWTMAAATFGMGAALTLSGASAYSLDNIVRRRYPKLANRSWFPFVTSGAIGAKAFKRLSLLLVFFTACFTLLTYNYYRGSIFTPYHKGPVSAGAHHIALSNGSVASNGEVTVTMYVDAGTPALPANIIRVELLNQQRDIVESWSGKELSLLPGKDIRNLYDYNKVYTAKYSLAAPLSSKAIIHLTPEKPVAINSKHYRIAVFTIGGHRYEIGARESFVTPDSDGG